MDHHSSSRSVQDPPAYSRTGSTFTGRSSVANPSSGFTEHIYSLTTSRDVPWVNLKLQSRARLPSQLPSFYEGEPITGMVEFNLQREDSIKAVSVRILGQMTTSSTNVQPFLSISQVLWETSMGDPSLTVPNPVKFRGKLLGSYQWPFTFTLPDTITLNGGDGPNREAPAWRIPPSFSERLTRVHIQYQLTVFIRRGKLRIDSQLGTVFAFTPVIKPGPFSLPRQVAYTEGTPLIGPDGDREGWETLEPVYVRGTIFSSRNVEAVCLLSLAKPLCYTRGSVIPCSLSISCRDAQGLDLLSMPRAIDIRLERHISMDFDAGRQYSYGLAYETATLDVQSAVWWPMSSGANNRLLMGEIHLARDLKPSCQVGSFVLTYQITFYNLKAVAFVPSDNSSSILRSQKVEIATAFAAGVRPRVYSPNPPSYDDASSIGPVSEFATRSV